MNLDDKLLEQYKDAYYFELNRKDKINGNLNLPLAIFTLLIGFVSYLLNNLPSFNSEISSIIFYILFFLLLITLIIALYFFIRSFYNYSYYYISMPLEFDDYFSKLNEYNNKVENSKRIEIEKKYKSIMKKQYSKYATYNTHVNDRKSKYLHNTSSALIISIIFMFLTSAPYFYIKYNTNLKDTLSVKKYQTEETFEMYSKNSNFKDDSNNKLNFKDDDSEEIQEPDEPEGRLIKEGEEKESEKKESKED